MPSATHTQTPAASNMTTMALLPLLKGDYLNGEEPTDWMQQFQLNLPPEEDQPTFGTACLPYSSSKEGTAQGINTLKEDDIGVMIDDEKGQEWGHVCWARQVQCLAQSFNDINCQYLDVVLEGVPDLLRNQLLDLYPDWGAFVTGVNNVSINSLSRARAKAKEEKEMRTQPTQQMYQQPVPQQIFQPQTIATVPQGNMPMQMQPPMQQLTPGNPFSATGVVPRTNLFYRYQPPQTPSPMHTSITERIRIAAQYAGIPQQPDTDVGRSAHAQQVKEWHEKNGANAVPHIGSPYPLKPGTAPLGSRECFACGLVTMPTHQAAGCPHPPLTFQEAKWRELVSSLVGRTLCNAAMPMTPSAPTQPSTPVQFIATTNAYVPQYPVAGAGVSGKWGWTVVDGENPTVHITDNSVDPAISDTPTLPTPAMSPEFASEILSALSPTSSALLDSGLVSAILSSSASEVEDATTSSDIFSDDLPGMVDVELPTIETLTPPDSSTLSILDLRFSDSSYVLPVVEDSSLTTPADTSCSVSANTVPASAGPSDDSDVASISTMNEPLNLYAVEGPQVSRMTGRPFITQITLFGEEGQALCFHAHVDDGAMINAIDTKAFLKASGRLSALQSSQQTLRMANGSIESSQGVWEGDIKWGNTKAHAIFEVFPSGNAWKVLIGKPLLEHLKVVHDYATDVITIPAPSNLYLQLSTLLNLFGTNSGPARTRTEKDDRPDKEATQEQTMLQPDTNAPKPAYLVMTDPTEWRNYQ
ncbi:hypothetical protein EV702DRAFT_1193483 [Suillus placidus]|uniref:Uncharacterized protein n=1 Tax=Suillus placidus TaxID=48579 RepID=A0A9P7D7E4_9AGAM|nr:hypothetical protein EV702DRAFT_1193483 [Suillus placidus]